MYEVKDGQRTLQFTGDLLGESSSRRNDSIRWIEFKIYRTTSGLYVLSRVGVSLIYHTPVCPMVKRYNLVEKPYNTLVAEATACATCQPTPESYLVLPEKNRHWAMVTEDPGAVILALYKQDDSGYQYLTKVAERVLEQAAAVDQNLDLEYRIEIIP